MENSLAPLIILILSSGMLSASEIALTALSEAKIRTMQDKNQFGVRAIIKLKKEPRHLLVGILVGNQLVNIIATVVATMWGIYMFGEEKITLVTLVFSLIIIMFGSITPKSIALVSPSKTAQVLAYPLLVFIYTAHPVIWFFEIINKGILKLFKVDKKNIKSATPEEIGALLDISAESGVIEKEVEELMKHILKFTETTAEDIMTVNKNIEGISRKINKDELKEFMVKTDRTHFPVYEENLDNIKGITEIHALMENIDHSRKKKPFADYKSNFTVVPKTTSIKELFTTFKEKRERMAIVVDEHGQTVGLVTIGDILEEMAGEKIEHEEKQEEVMIKKISPGRWEAKGETTIDQINKELDTKLPYPEHETISLAILKKLKRFPESGEKVKMDHIEIRIETISKKTINKILLRKTNNTEEENN